MFPWINVQLAVYREDGNEVCKLPLSTHAFTSIYGAFVETCIHSYTYGRRFVAGRKRVCGVGTAYLMPDSLMPCLSLFVNVKVQMEMIYSFVSLGRVHTHAFLLIIMCGLHCTYVRQQCKYFVFFSSETISRLLKCLATGCYVGEHHQHIYMHTLVRIRAEASPENSLRSFNRTRGDVFHILLLRGAIVNRNYGIQKTYTFIHFY